MKANLDEASRGLFVSTRAPSELSPHSVAFHAVALANVFAHTDQARPILRELQACCSFAILTEELVGVLPVRFLAHGFFRPEGESPLAVIVPCRARSGLLVDVAAFDPHGFARGTLFNRAWCISGSPLTDGELDRGSVRVHHDVWSWLKSECCGLLVLDWRKASVAFAQRGITSLRAADAAQARALGLELKRASTMPEILVDDEQ